MFIYTFLIRTTLVVLLCKHQSNGLDRSPTITDEVCEPHSFVRTFNQQNKQLFKIEQKLSILDKMPSFKLHTPEDDCSFGLDKNVFFFNCAIETEGECSKFNFKCTYFSIGNFVTATIEAAENLDDIYANTTLTSIYYNVSKSITLQYCSLDDENVSVSSSNLSYGQSVVVQCVDKGSHIVQGENIPSDNELTLTCDECGQWRTNDPVHCVKEEPTFTDPVCKEHNSFVRTFNQTNKELFTLKQFLYEDKFSFELETSNDLCEFQLVKSNNRQCKYKTVRPTETSCEKFKISCVSGGPKTVTASIGAILDLDHTYMNTTLRSLTHHVSKSITLKYCHLENKNISVSSINSSYGDNITVRCIDKGSHMVQGDNFPFNNEVLLTCGECGQWETYDSFHCVKVTLDAQPVYFENETANFICNSNEDGWSNHPPDYFLNGANITGQHEDFLLNRQYHTNTVYCVMYLNNKNRSEISSSIKTIAVHYQPYDVMVNVSSTYVTVHTNDGLVLIYDQNVIVHCSSDSNPVANCSFNIESKTIKSDGTCDVAYRFSQSANVTCTASNELNNVTSSTIEVVLLQPREDLNANLSQTNQQPITESDLTLDCSIPYQEELRTIFSWTIPSDRDLEKNGSILYLDNLTRFDMGNYTCTTTDVFGVSSRTTFVDVYYSPEEIESTTQCHWSDVENSDCSVTFTSNPSAEIYTLTRNGSSYHCSYCRWEQSFGDKYRQTFILKLEEQESQTLVYQVRFTSSYHLFGDLIVEFVVQGSDVTHPTVNQTALIVGCVVGVVLLLGVVIALGCVYHRNKNKVLSEKEIIEFSSTKKLHGLNSKAAKCSDANVYEDIDLKKMNKDTNDKQASNEKEDRLNPLYAVREDISDVKKSSTTTNCDKETENNSDEKEDRINPLYDIGRETPVEHVYAEVEKTSKKNINSLDNPNEQEQSETEDRVNPLYAVREENADGQHLYAQIDKSTKKDNEKGQVEKEEQINPLYDVGQGKGDKNVDLGVMRNDTGQEEQVNPQYGEELRQKTEMEHNYDEVHF